MKRAPCFSCRPDRDRPCTIESASRWFDQRRGVAESPVMRCASVCTLSSALLDGSNTVGGWYDTVITKRRKKENYSNYGRANVRLWGRHAMIQREQRSRVLALGSADLDLLGAIGIPIEMQQKLFRPDRVSTRTSMALLTWKRERGHAKVVQMVLSGQKQKAIASTMAS